MLAWLTVMGGIGLLWWFPDAISQLRQQAQPYAEMAEGCALDEGPCTATFPDGAEVSLSVSPRPFHASVPLQWEVRTDGPAPQAIEVQGRSMNMGLVRIALEAGEPGTWHARAALPVCTTQRMAWRADVVFPGRTAGFRLESTQLGAGHGAPAPAPDIAPVDPTWSSFDVVTAAGPLSLDALRGRPAIVYFGYLSCPDVCPTTMATLGAALRNLPERPHVLFVSVDPERDTPERLAAYVQYFGEDFRGGIVADGHLPEVAADWGVVYRKVADPGSAMAYTMDHSTQAFLLDAAGQLARQLPHGMPPSEIAEAVREVW